MSTASVPRTDSAETDLRPDDLKQDLGHIRDLVFLRDLLQARGATASEMWEYQTTIATPGAVQRIEVIGDHRDPARILATGASSGRDVSIADGDVYVAGWA